MIIDAINQSISSFYAIHPVQITLLVWFWGFGSLLLVALRTKTVKKVLLKSPSIMMGDFFILPVTAFMILYFIQELKLPTQEVDIVTIITLGVAIIFTFISVLRFHYASLWWIPHILFYTFMAFFVLSFIANSLLYFSENQEDIQVFGSVLFVLVLLGMHQFLGITFPKKFSML